MLSTQNYNNFYQQFRYGFVAIIDEEEDIVSLFTELL